MRPAGDGAARLDDREAVRQEVDAAGPRARIEPALWIALAASIISAAMLAPEWFLAPPQLNDNVLHVALARYAAEHWGEHWPVDHWFPSVAAGFPVFAHYPHLPHLASAALGRGLGVDAGRVYLGLSSLLLASIPLSIFFSARRIGISACAAAGAAALYPLLSSKGYYGIGWDSYVWRTHGLSVQLWGTFFLFPALAWGARAIRDGEGRYAAGLLLGACILAHFLLGYVAAVSLFVLACLPDRSAPAGRRFLRLASVGAVAAAATAYFTLPFLLYRDELLLSRWEPAWKWSSMGWRWLLPRLFRGEIFDGGSLAVLSVSAALGLAIAIGGRLRATHRPERWIATCFVVWTVLLFGRPTLGRLVDALPFASGLHMHRFIAGVQAFGLLLAGSGLAAVIEWTRSRTRSWVAAALVAAAIVAVPVAQRISYMRENTQWARAAKQKLAAAADFHDVLAELRALPPARVHAGFRNTWGKDFQIGDIPVYTHLQAAGFDMVGYLFMAMARPGEWQVRLNYMRPEHLDLFDARYLLAPPGRAMPAGAVIRAERDDYALYEVPTSGYFALGTIAPPPADFSSAGLSTKEPWEVAYGIGDRWLSSGEPARRHFLSMREGAPDVVLESADGAILSETIAPDRYAATVTLPAAADLVLKVTHHPRWQATIDGRAVATLPVFPGFTSVRVPAGRHDVRFHYRPPAWKKALFAVALSMFVGGLIATLLRRLRGARTASAT